MNDSTPPAPHAVARLRAERLARSAKPFLARGGPKGERCAGCRLVPSHCICALRPALTTRAGMCLLMADIEPLKPSNTGWLIADVVADTYAFGWARTEVHTDLLELLLEQAREFEALEQRLNAAEAALQSQQLQLETCGSIAEASLKLNGVFEAAQKAAEQYQQNVERLCQEKISAAESQAQEILARAKKAANQQ